MTQRNPLDRSVAFTALLELRPGFGQLENKAASVMTGRFLEDFYASGSKDMGAYARSWDPEASAQRVVAGLLVSEARNCAAPGYESTIESLVRRALAMTMPAEF